ncbi:MAG: flippase-like domain-containing protein [Desulfovibrio sp.]|nr:flippase-like domain-containing protein [Desulfovibrio sp.]
MKSKKFSAIATSVFGILLFGACFWLTEFPDPERLRDADMGWFCVAILAQGGFALLMPVRWQIMSAGAGVRLPYGPAFEISAYASLAAAVIPQSLADLAGRGPWEAKFTGCGLLNATNIILCDRLLDVYIIALLLPAGIAYSIDSFSPRACVLFGSATLLCGLLFLLALKEKFFEMFEILFRWLRWCLEKLPILAGRFNWHVSPIKLTYSALFKVYAISVIKFFVIAFSTLAYFAFVNIDVSLTAVFFALPLTQFVFIFAFTPGGLGIFELGWTGILAARSISASQISLFLLSQRLCFTVGVIVWALIAWAWSKAFPLSTAEKA